MEDEHRLLQRGPVERDRALDDFARLGADTVRSLVYWNDIAPAPARKRKPAGFDGRLPQAYDAAAWDRYDDMVRGARARGLDVILSPTAPLPAWASGCKGGLRKRRSCKPKVGEYGAFVQALATRYSGTYADENQGGAPLPRVSRWSIWNEPNQAGWLSPQSVRRNGRVIAFAAHRYRALAKAAIRALDASGHGSDQILLGETAPLGRTSGPLARRPLPPVKFISELFCLTSRGGPQRGAQAKRNGCRRPGKLAVDGFAHHPYTPLASRAPRSRALPGWITIATAGRLKTLLDRGARAGRVPGRLPILYTEYGFQTNPPDRFGVSLAKQARHINESDWIAYRDPRVKSVAQYKLVDDQAAEHFQTGLRFYNGVAKPSYSAYRLPIWVSRRGKDRVLVYGQVRPLANGVPGVVEIQNGRPGAFATVATVTVTSARGHFVATLPRRAGKWRLRWGGLTSRQTGVARR